MKLSPALISASVGLVAAHGNFQHVPKLLGGKRLLLSSSFPHAEAHRVVGESVKHQKRQSNTDGSCGRGVGSCATGYCCSSAGWCGKGIEYCAAPDCQINYGSGCDGNKKPSGADTSKVARPKVGNVPYGGNGVYDCVNPGTIALTFDDGPYIYTNDLLDKLKSYGAKATFFITGNNIGKGMINDPSTPYPAILKRMHNEGHQIASHTWSHENASQMTNTQMTNQMVYNEIAINSVLGYFPTYMRPPYSICAAACQTILAQLGYHVIYFDLDTQGYLNGSPDMIQKSKNIWDSAMQSSNPQTDSFLQIEHDIHQQTVYNLTDYILKSMATQGYRSVTVGECLGDPFANWYRTGPGGSAPPSPTTSSSTASTSAATAQLAVSTDATCGNGVTCLGSPFGNCCSHAGWCGTTADYCAPSNGCQPAYGSCSGSPGSVLSSSSASSILPSSSSVRSVPPTSLSSSVAIPTSSSKPAVIATSSSQPVVIPPSSSKPVPAPSSSVSSRTSVSSAVSQPTNQPLKVSSNGQCGNGFTCQGSSYGSCCDRNNQCSWFLGCFIGCQRAFGACY